MYNKYLIVDDKDTQLLLIHTHVNSSNNYIQVKQFQILYNIDFVLRLIEDGYLSLYVYTMD